jgi:hypothetical protein
MAQVKVLTKRIAVPRTSIGSDGTFEDLSATNNGVLKYVAVNAAQDVPNFRDGDDFYPFDGKGDSFQDEVFPEKDEFSYTIGSNIRSFFSPQETAKRRELRYEKKGAKNQESLSRARRQENWHTRFSSNL